MNPSPPPQVAPAADPTLMQPTAEIPSMDARRQRLVAAFYHGGLWRLMKEMYVIAEEDLEACNDPQNTRSVRYSMELMTADYRGPREMYDLLCSLPTRVVEALLLNTIGHEYSTDDEFKKLFYRTDATACIYMNTFVVKGKDKTAGRRLNRLEWKEVQRRIQRYIDFAGEPITANSSQDAINAADEAEEIDNAYDIRDANQRKVERHWLNAHKQTEVFSEKLKERIRKDLDPNGVIRQKQTPCKCGRARKLAQEMPAPDKWSELTATAAPWGLTLSILKVMGIDVEIVFVPIFKVWTESQYRKAEILGTFLLGSLVYDGGFNPKPPCTNPGRDDSYEYEGELREVFFEQDWHATNLKRLDEEVGMKIKDLDWLAGMDVSDDYIDGLGPSRSAPGHVPDKLDKLIAEVDQVGDELAGYYDECCKQLEELKKVNDKREKFIKNVNNMTAKLQGAMDFHEHLHQFLDGTWVDSEEGEGNEDGEEEGGEEGQREGGEED